MIVFPVNVDVPMSRWPITNWVLIGVITGASVLGWLSEPFYFALTGLSRPEISAPHFGKGPRDSRGAPEDAVEQAVWEMVAAMQKPEFRPAAWRLPMLAVTSCFVHADILHLAGNMLFLWVFGNAVNYKFGHLGFLALFSGTALVGGLASYWHTPGFAVVGASGAIMGVVGAYVVFFPRNDVILFRASLYFGSDTAAISSWIAIVFWVAFDVLHLVFGSQEHIAYASHVAGFVSGFAAAWFLARAHVLVPTRYEETLPQILGLD